MQWLRNLPVSRKFIFAFGIVCGLCIVLGAYTFFTFHDIAAKAPEVSGTFSFHRCSMADIRKGVNLRGARILSMLLCPTPACSADHAAKRQKAIADYKERRRDYEPLIG